MKHLFIIDPIEQINVKKDTSFAFMLEAQRRKDEVWYATIQQLSGQGSSAFARATRVLLRQKQGAHFRSFEAERKPLSDFQVIWMRKDPPFTMDYIYATYLLELLDPDKTLVLNSPSGLRNANEKAFIMHFPSVIPETMITKSAEDIRAFMKAENGKAVVKPLDQMGGKGIFLLRDEDPNLASLIEMSTKNGNEFVMIQAFVPEAAVGDKRILLMDGKPLGAVLRVPSGKDFRGNLAVGGKAIKTSLTKQDWKIVETVSPVLKKAGLVFVGLDVLGGYLAEINVTSPTGIQEINRLNQVQIERKVLDWVAAKNK